MAGKAPVFLANGNLYDDTAEVSVPDPVTVKMQEAPVVRNVMPDVKLPEKNVSDEYLPHENELNVNHRNFDRNRVRLFDENKVYGELIRAEMFPEFSNSFLIVAKGV